MADIIFRIETNQKCGTAKFTSSSFTMIKKKGLRIYDFIRMGRDMLITSPGQSQNIN
jgi:hypothetical protein